MIFIKKENNIEHYLNSKVKYKHHGFKTPVASWRENKKNNNLKIKNNKRLLFHISLLLKAIHVSVK
jgi:hypothetical protein